MMNSWPCAKSAGLLLLAAACALAGCGKQGTTDATRAAPPEVATPAAVKDKCYLPVGHPSEHDAELFAAAQAGDVERGEQALAAGANVNASDSLQRTALFAAAFCNQAAMTGFLIDKGSAVNAKDFDGQIPLHAAVVAGTEDVAKVLLTHGANINSPNSMGRTPLHLAAATGQLTLVELLLEHGANAQLRDKNGSTAESLAANNGHRNTAAAIARWLAKKSPNPPTK